MESHRCIALLLFAASLPALAYTEADMDRGRPGGIRAELFAEHKAIESYSHRERIRILQEADACIHAAADRIQYRACEDREGQAREQLKSVVRARHDALRARADGIRQGMLGRW